MTYAFTLLGGLVAGMLMLPVVQIMFPSPTDEELERVRPLVWEPPVVERPQSGYEGSLGRMVARGHGHVRSVGRRAYRGVAHVAKHARRMVWQRPSDYVRSHRRAGAYHATISSVVMGRDFLDEANCYIARHSDEYIDMVTGVQRMIDQERVHA